MKSWLKYLLIHPLAVLLLGMILTLAFGVFLTVSQAGTRLLLGAAQRFVPELALAISVLLTSAPLRHFPFALDLLGKAPLVNFGGTIINPERPDFTEHLLDNGLVGNPGAAHYLHAVVGNLHSDHWHWS